MKFQAPNFGPAHSARLEKLKALTLDLRAALSEKSKEVADLKESLRAAETSRATHSRTAAMNADAAMRMTGFETQVKLLQPILLQKERALQNAVEVARKQIGHIRRDDLGKLLWPPLSEQILVQVKSALAPFFAASTLNAAAQFVAGESLVAKYLETYTNRRDPNLPDAETAIKWLWATADELGEALSGKEIIEIDPITETFTYPDSRAIDRHSIDMAA